MQVADTRTVWVDGELMPWEKVNVYAGARAPHRGNGHVSEGIRCYPTERGPAVFRLEEHIHRLFASAYGHGITIPFTPAEVGAAVCQTIAANQFASCYVRTTILGPAASARGASPVELAVLAWPWPATFKLPAGRAERYSRWLHFVDDCTFAGAYSALPCI